MIMIYRRDGDTGGDIEGIDCCGFVKNCVYCIADPKLPNSPLTEIAVLGHSLDLYSRIIPIAKVTQKILF